MSHAPPSAEGAAFRALGDPLVDALVDEALAANLDIVTARATLARARAQADLAAAGRAVQVGTSASVSRSRAQEREANSLRAGFDASWDADLFGALRHAADAARLEADASAALLADARRTVAGATAAGVLQWRTLRTQQALTEASLASQRESFQLVRWRAQAGLASTLDEQQAAANLEQTVAQVPQLAASRVQAEHRLALLTGQPPTALADRLARVPADVSLTPPGAASGAAGPSGPSLAASSTPLPALGVPADLLRRRADLHAAELRVQAARSSLAQSRAERAPDLRLSGSLALQAATWSALGGPAAVLASIAAAVDWPLADGGAGAARVQAQRAALDAAYVAWRATLLTALQQVEDELVVIANAGERIAALERALAAAESGLALARARYGSGLADLASLLESERAVLSSRTSLANARGDLAQAQVRLRLALGGDWASDESAPIGTAR